MKLFEAMRKGHKMFGGVMYQRRNGYIGLANEADVIDDGKEPSLDSACAIGFAMLGQYGLAKTNEAITDCVSRLDAQGFGDSFGDSTFSNTELLDDRLNDLAVDLAFDLPNVSLVCPFWHDEKKCDFKGHIAAMVPHWNDDHAASVEHIIHQLELWNI